MASTITVSDALAFVSTLLKNQSLNVNNQRPGLNMANIVLQRMLAAPFLWRFNRTSFTIALTASGPTDYVESLPALGWIETQWLTDANSEILELNGAVELAKVSTVRRPILVAPVYDDNAGNITFRFNSVPDQAYTAYFDYQQKAPILQSPGDNFGPVPDEFSFLFLKGLLSEGALLVNDSRFPIWRSEWVAGMLALQTGLDEQAKAIFYNQMMNNVNSNLQNQYRQQNAGKAAAV